MEYDRIIIELLNRIQSLEERVDKLEKDNLSIKIDKGNISPASGSMLEKISAKYRGLAKHLLETNEYKVVLTYPQIEQLLGFSLPSSARNHMRSFWANTETHSYSSSWLAVGYEARVNVETETITFEKKL